MRFVNFAWWTIYIIIAIILQKFVHGVDFLLPGLIVALQERKIVQFLVVIVSFILIQEGTGTMPFGNIFLWYFVVIIFFYAWQWFFEVESFIFILLLSIALSISHYLIISILSDIQDIYINSRELQDECVYQVFITPLMWHLANYLRKGIRRVA